MKKKMNDVEGQMVSYVAACVGNFKSGYEYGCSIGVRGEITEDYFENNSLESLVEKNQKYNKYKQLFPDKYHERDVVDNSSEIKSVD